MQETYSPPQLFIIAGPNGAGKSTTSKNLLSTYKIDPFDWDKVFYEKWSLFGYDPAVEQVVRNSTNELFEDLKTQALDSKTSFAFETNYHTPVIVDTINQFKEHGFEVNLYFLLVSSPEICKERVAYRVNFENGHHVNDETIEARFIGGLKVLDDTFQLFNRTFLFDASKDHDASLIASFERGKLVGKYKAIPIETIPDILRISYLLQ